MGPEPERKQRMTSPYDSLGPEAFWRSAVAEGAPFEDAALYRPRFEITPETALFTAGSCFAQHVTQALRAAKCNVIDTEPRPFILPDHVGRRFGYGLYSARFGNIYTLRQFRQLVAEAAGDWAPAGAIWQRGEAVFDALRPSVEPEGFGSVEALRKSRSFHLEAVREGLAKAEVFIFTLGLTECWEDRVSGTVYPTAPETIAGQFDPDLFAFRNLSFGDHLADFKALLDGLAGFCAQPKFLFTVSPVPLTATASGTHVLPATTYSKAVLRAFAGEAQAASEAVDYFPAYELVTGPSADHGPRFEPNLRSVAPATVARVMARFFAAHGLAQGSASADAKRIEEAEDPLCDELLLEALASLRSWPSSDRPMSSRCMPRAQPSSKPIRMWRRGSLR
jgi:hypothetical protein